MNKSKRRIRRMNDRKYKKHLKYLAEDIGDWYPQPSYYNTGTWKNPREEKYCYYKRLYRSKISKYLKNQTNRKLRRYKDEIKSGNQYRRLLDFWWELT